MKYFTLLQLNKSVQKLVHGINKDFWITAEISNVQVNDHCYMELVQKEGERIVAKSRAMIWASQLAVIGVKLGESLDTLLKNGTKLLLQVRVTFHEIHGMSLVVADIDPSYTIGELELKRLETIRQLEEQGLIDLQKSHSLPAVIQRIAIVSSKDAAGFTDFMNQLTLNDFGYRFSCTFFQSAVQGEKAEKEILMQLGKINPDHFDVVILIRGGGSKLDLEVFNSYVISEFIANMDIPVITGIGHQRDETVCDIVAHTAMKTPTAAAEFIIQRALIFETRISSVFENILGQANGILHRQKIEIQEFKSTISRSVINKIHQEKLTISNAKLLMTKNLQFIFERNKAKVKQLSRQIANLDPQKVLERGYSLTLRNGQIIKEEIKVGDSITTITATKVIESTVKQVKTKK
ncbi:exodeoxyribonuclease VII large subunit [Flexithrix dorotheae]|uniref:exodeoxyribonuclease VII large subunit n=1 Tax=Flexithrix dorotheae TaxID=70993 RepID=UPI00039E320A|nr:exodeoxyribonuclease VII large subunit [Flexithrix dorotheae]